jgi:ribosomal protein L11 methylase PrmA
MEIVTQIIEQVKPQSVWDMGANIGLYSRIPSRLNIPTVAFDIDPGAVERNYQDVKENQVTNLLPLVLDLTNPSPAIGWHNRERLSLSQRTNPHLILALALIHHLAIANNLPLAMVAEFFSSFASWLVIEFVPKVDTQVQRMLASREDIFTNYTTQGFETAFQGFYRIITRRQIRDSERSIYLMKRRIADENQSQTAFSL